MTDVAETVIVPQRRLLFSSELYDTLRGLRDKGDAIARELLYHADSRCEGDDPPNNFFDVKDNDITYITASRREQVLREQHADLLDDPLSTGTFNAYRHCDTNASCWAPRRISLRTRTRPVKAARYIIDKWGGDPESFTDQQYSKFADQWALARAPKQVDQVRGDDVVSHYAAVSGSCMSYDNCANYLRIYADNTRQVSMLVVKEPSPETSYDSGYGAHRLALARGLVWHFPDGRALLDRTYGDWTCQQAIRAYATEQGWWVKRHDQSIFIDPDGNERESVPPEMGSLVLDFAEQRRMPYADTYRFLCRECGWISMYTPDEDSCPNCERDSSVVVLESTSGGHTKMLEYGMENLGWDDDRCEICSYRSDNCTCTYCDECDLQYDAEQHDECPNLRQCEHCEESYHPYLGRRSMDCPNGCYECELCHTWRDSEDDECPACLHCPTCSEPVREHEMLDGQCVRCASVMHCDSCGASRRRDREEMAFTHGTAILYQPWAERCYQCNGPMSREDQQRIWHWMRALAERNAATQPTSWQIVANLSVGRLSDTVYHNESLGYIAASLSAAIPPRLSQVELESYVRFHSRRAPSWSKLIACYESEHRERAVALLLHEELQRQCDAHRNEEVA